MDRSGMMLELPPLREGPVFLAVAASIIGEIERGRLRSGDRLPGTRAIARMLRLNRNTVDAAFHELTMQGWLVADPSRGTFVARDLPDFPTPPSSSATPSEAESPATRRADASELRVGDGTPDPRIMPHAELARAFRRSLTAPSFLGGPTYGDPRGALALRVALSRFLADERGLMASPEGMLVTRGSQMGLYLAAASALRLGEVIAVEEPGYPHAWTAFRAAGARIVGIPVDEGGIDLDRLQGLVEGEPGLRAVYVTPHHQYPSTVTLGAGRRLRLLDMARRHRLLIIEDDYDHEYRFDGRPVLPLAARAGPEQAIIYVGSLSKLLAPGVRLGYAVAPAAILARMAELREAIDRQGDVPLEQALANMIVDGDLRRHARKARRIYAARRDLLARDVTDRLGGLVSFDLPAGGLALWLRVREGVSAEQWSGDAARMGLTIASGLRFALDPARAPNAFRFGFADLNAGELERAVTLLLASAPRAVIGRSGP